MTYENKYSIFEWISEARLNHFAWKKKQTKNMILITEHNQGWICAENNTYY